MDEVLFICTGNYYRSRFAEALFNHQAWRRKLPWAAFSRGTAIHLADGPLSPFTAEALRVRGIPLNFTAPGRQQITEADLARASLRFALKEAEHRPHIREFFPAYENLVTYWTVHDLDAGTPAQAFAAIEVLVGELVETLAAGGKA